jgi:16S rRNA (guanine527-N7)-methyltransferase
MSNKNQKLIQGLQQIGFEQNSISPLVEKMEKYINELILFNSAYNLVNTSDYQEIVIRHILDSLAAVPVIKTLAQELNTPTISIGDIGSGGGLPGIPLAAALPEYKFSLVERMDKRCAFLENEKAILGLTNLTVIKSEAEKIPPETFDITTFRAFRPLDKKITNALISLTKTGGYLAAYKAKYFVSESKVL